MSKAESSRPPARLGEQFAKPLLAWFDVHGRHDLPWQQPRSAYRVWLSEVMLQQTQVRTVIPYFERFVQVLPNLAALAAAEQDQVLALWSGLGYYSRARNLHRSAQICLDQHDGELPRDVEQLAALPGIGRSTAAAIAAQVHGDRHAILDGNVRRVLARWHGLHGWPGASAVQQRLWQLAEAHTPATRIADYTQAIMDLGATVCTRARPRCTHCPVRSNCVALASALTDTLPERKPSRVQPTRSTTMLMLRDPQQRILLQRRPATGVWAALWSFPEAPDVESAAPDLLHRYGIDARSGSLQTGFTHVFSHFRLHITPLLLHTTNSACVRIADQPDLNWFSLAEALALGLPAPVRKLITILQENPT